MSVLEQRSQEQEIMDDLDISGEVVDQTLRELNTINRLLGGNLISIASFKQLVRDQPSVTLADLGCGGGDILMDMASWCRKKQIMAEFVGFDANPNIIAYAENNTARYSEITYQSVNILEEEFASMQFDIIHCCLFTHHFTDDELVRLFKQFKEQARLGVVINDLHRHFLAYQSISLLTRLFSRSSMVRNDAAVSVARGFSRRELTSILERAGIKEYQLSWKWAFRWSLTF